MYGDIVNVELTLTSDNHVWAIGLQEIRTEHLQQEQMHKLLPTEGGAQCRGLGIESGKFQNCHLCQNSILECRLFLIKVMNYSRVGVFSGICMCASV